MELHTSLREIIGTLKEFYDADPADSHHAPESKERQKSRPDGLRSRLLLWRSSPQWMRDDLDNIYMLLFRFIGKGFQLALCVGWLATQESVVLVPAPVVFAPWSMLLDRGEPCDSLQFACSVLSIEAVDPLHALSQVHWQGALDDGVDGMKGDTIKLLSDDDGSRKRGVPCGHLARQLSHSFRSLDDKGDGAD